MEMTDIRELIARALSAQTTCDGAPHPSELHYRQADAVLAVLAEYEAKVRAETLRAARDEINRTRNVASLMTLADKFGGYYQGQRVGLEIAEGIVSRIERGEQA